MLEFIGMLLYKIGNTFKYSDALLIGIMSLDGVIISILFPKTIEVKNKIFELYHSEKVRIFLDKNFYLPIHIVINLIFCLIVLSFNDTLRYIHIAVQFLLCWDFAYCVLRTYIFYKHSAINYMTIKLEKKIKRKIKRLIKVSKNGKKINITIDILRDILINPLYTNENYLKYNNITEELLYLREICKDLSVLDFNKNKVVFFDLLDIKILNIFFEIYEICKDKLSEKLNNIQTEIYQMLVYFTSRQDFEIEVNYILERLYSCMRSDKNSLIPYYRFYIIVFDRFRKEKFNNIYLDKFNNYAFNVVKYLLDINDLKTFKNIIDCSIGHSLDIYDPEGKNEDNIKIRKYRNLFLKISSLALYKKNYEALDLLFNFHTPKDSRTIFCNKDILPHSIEDVFEWIFNNNIWLEDLEDHHGTQLYYEVLKYLLILRSLYYDGRIVNNVQLEYLNNVSLSDLYMLQQLNSDALKKYHPNVKYNDKDLEKSKEHINSIVDNIFDNINLLNIIGIKEPNRIKDEFIDALYKISELANKQEENIIKTTECSEDKIIKFKREILSNYTENEGLLSVIKQYDLVTVDSYNNFEKSEFWYFNNTLPKEMFLNDYPVSYVGFASSYGEEMRRTENYRILEKIREKTKIDYIENLEDLIYNNKNKDDLFIILNYADLFNLRSLQKTMGIILKDKYLFSEEEKSKFNKYYNLKNFSGIMIFKDISIPVYSCFMGDDKSQLFLLSKNKEKFGSVVEYIYNGEGNEYFDEQTKLFCKLSEMEDKKSVWLQLYKKIDINLSDNFDGYMISLKDM